MENRYKMIPQYVEPDVPPSGPVAVSSIPENPGYKRILGTKVYILDDNGKMKEIR